MQEQVTGFERGVFTISLDFELIWGTADLGLESFKRLCEIERREVIDRLLALFEEFEFPATWAILGHLFLERCAPVDGVKHPEITRPDFPWVEGDWFDHDVCGVENDESIHLGRSLVEKIQRCRVSQEIGSHSFSHVIFGNQGCSRETAKAEIDACVKAAETLGIDLRSFVFPRNEIGHLDVLKECGFSNFRGVEPNWFEARSVSEKLRRGLRLIDVLTAAKPPVVVPELTGNGLWNIPGSAMFFPMHGFRRHIPMNFRVRRCLKGLESAAAEKKIFHLWFHPTNMVDEIDTMFAGLRQIMERASELRSNSKIEFMTMGGIVQRLESRGD
jgi:peptidoglycan/xylan/chitin deacetylase (PgdA/CDA1 family)